MSLSVETPRRLTRQQQRREATIDEIKSRARAQLAEGGAGALSLRAVARDMGLSSAAIYRYFANQSDLIVALCVDSYLDLAETIEETCAAGDDPVRNMWNVFSTFRSWSLANPSDFALVFGTPFPGFQAPPGETTEAAARFARCLVSTYHDAVRHGAVDLSMVEMPSERKLGELAEHLITGASDLPAELGPGVLLGWVWALGFVVAELWGNLGRMFPDPDSAFEANLRQVMRGMGFRAELVGALRKE